MKNSHLGQAWLVLLLALCFGGGLSAIEITLGPLIQANRLEETIGQIPELVPGATTGSKEMVGELPAYRAIDESEQTVGWVIPTGGQGFADRIEVLLGLDAEAARITGVYVLDQKETPGLGNKIVEAGWRSQFTDKAVGAPLVVTKAKPSDDREIEGITGATISSDAVVDIVNRTAADFRAALGAGL